MKIVKTITKGTNEISIMRVVKIGTKRVFFFAMTADKKRITSTLFARQYDAEELAKAYLKAI